MPVNKSTIVVFPDPDGPINPVIVFLFNLKFTLSNNLSFPG